VISQQQAVSKNPVVEFVPSQRLQWRVPPVGTSPTLGSRSIARQVRPRDRAPTKRVSAHMGHDRSRGHPWHARLSQHAWTLAATMRRPPLCGCALPRRRPPRGRTELRCISRDRSPSPRRQAARFIRSGNAHTRRQSAQDVAGVALEASRLRRLLRCAAARLRVAELRSDGCLRRLARDPGAHIRREMGFRRSKRKEHTHGYHRIRHQAY
jgi:hypothetical protein